jgi:IclR family acetate operon transcriptional repressor
MTRKPESAAAGGAARDVAHQAAGPDALTPSRRVLLVLQAFAETGEWGVRELSFKLGLSRSSVHRTLQEMAHEGLLRATAESRYSLAPALLRIGTMLSLSSDLLRAARPHALALRDATRETVFVNAYDRERKQYISVLGAESPRQVRLSYQPQDETWVPLHAAASGKAILAFLPDKEREEAIADVAELAHPESRTALTAELDAIRRRGWAYSYGERMEGAHAVAAPITDAAMQIVADMVVGWPMRSEEIDIAGLGRTCKAAADAVSADLGAAQYSLPRWDV